MDARDLMLGDWVAISKTAEDGLIYAHEKESHGRDYFCITGFSSSIGYDENIAHYEIPSIYNCTCISGIHCKYIEPIRLDKEILVKCGFEKLPESEYTINTYELHGIQIWVNNGQFLLLSKYPIDYLHELQQVFRLLTKQDLQITL